MDYIGGHGILILWLSDYWPLKLWLNDNFDFLILGTWDSRVFTGTHWDPNMVALCKGWLPSLDIWPWLTSAGGSYSMLWVLLSHLGVDIYWCWEMIEMSVTRKAQFHMAVCRLDLHDYRFMCQTLLRLNIYCCLLGASYIACQCASVFIALGKIKQKLKS